MRKTKIFKSGNSLAVRIPKEYKLEANEVYIDKQDDKLIIFPVEDKWDMFEELLSQFTEEDVKDFLEDRNQPMPQERELF